MKKLSNVEMKQIIGGSASGGKLCMTRADCGPGEACLKLPPLPKNCISVERGSGCSGDEDCGNGTNCIPRPYPFSGNWCN